MKQILKVSVWNLIQDIISIFLIGIQASQNKDLNKFSLINQFNYFLLLNTLKTQINHSNPIIINYWKSMSLRMVKF